MTIDIEAREPNSKNIGAFEDLEKLYFDPVSSSTRHSGWILSIAAFLLICTSILKIETVGLLMINLSPNVLAETKNIALSILVIGLLVPYLLRAYSETLRKRDVDTTLYLAARARAYKYIREARDSNEWECKTGGQLDELPDEYGYLPPVNSHADVFNKKLYYLNKKIVTSTLPFSFRQLRFWLTLLTPIAIAAFSLFANLPNVVTGLRLLFSVPI